MILIWDCTLFLGFYTYFWSYDFQSDTRMIIVFVVVFALNILRQIFAKRRSSCYTYLYWKGENI